MKNVVHIFGASGSGTSTLGRALCQAAGLFLMDTDDYYWLPVEPRYSRSRPAEERLRLMRQDIRAHSGVVIAGSLTDWGDPLMAQFTLAIRLETDTHLRLTRLCAREHAAFGDRVEPGGDRCEEYQAFLRWAAEYDEGGIEMRSKRKHDEWQRQLTCPLLTLNGADDPTQNAARILPLLGARE